MQGVALLWCLWQERNKVNHQECRLSISEFKFMLERHTDEWKSLNKKSQQSQCGEKRCWQPPPVDTIKINLDGAFREDTHSGGWGAIARDSAGDTVFAAAGRVSVAADALHTELLALVNVIPIVESQGIWKIIFSTDCLVLKQAMETSSYDFSSLGQLLLHPKFTLSTSFIQSSFEYSSQTL
jgi:hypothetical protein